jgi:hypothetical protein
MSGLFLPDQRSHPDVIRPYLDPIKVRNAVDVDHDAWSNGPLREQRDQTLAARQDPSAGPVTP